jgi:glycine cleavage system H protein
VVYVELPKVGTEVQAGKQVCVVESVKAASDIYAPASGKVVAVNEALGSNPALLNTDPYGNGWIFRLELKQPEETNSLKSPADYTAQIGGA